MKRRGEYDLVGAAPTAMTFGGPARSNPMARRGGNYSAMPVRSTSQPSRTPMVARPMGLAVVRRSPAPGSFAAPRGPKLALVQRGGPLSTAPLANRWTPSKVLSLKSLSRTGVIQALKTPTPPAPGQGTRTITINPPRSGGLGQKDVTPGQPMRKPITITVRSHGTAGSAPKLTPAAVKALGMNRALMAPLRLGSSTPAAAPSPRLRTGFSMSGSEVGSDPNADWGTWAAAWNAMGNATKAADRALFDVEYANFNAYYTDPDEMGYPRDPDAWAQYIGSLIAFQEMIIEFFRRFASDPQFRKDILSLGANLRLGFSPTGGIAPGAVPSPYGTDAYGNPVDAYGVPAPNGVDPSTGAAAPPPYGADPYAAQPYGAQPPPQDPYGGYGGYGSPPPMDPYGGGGYGAPPPALPYGGDGGGDYGGDGLPPPTSKPTYAKKKRGRGDEDGDDERTYDVRPDDDMGPPGDVVDKDLLSDLFGGSDSSDDDGGGLIF